MKIFKDEPTIGFMAKRFYAFAFSGAIILMGIILFLTRDFNLGIDFTGGTLIEVSFKNETTVNQVRQALGKIGMGKSTIMRIENENKFFIKTDQVFDIGETAAENTEAGTEEAAETTLEMASTAADSDQHSGFIAKIKDALMSEEEKQLDASPKLDINDASEKRIKDFLINKGIDEVEALDAAKKLIALTTENTSGLIHDFSEIEKAGLPSPVLNILKQDSYLGGFTFMSTESVGPQVGHDLRGKVTRAAIYSLIGMLIYIGFRFSVIYGISAVITLIHDVLVTLSFILLFNIEVSLPVVAAILTIVGYSLNDTIVIFDRVRDNVKMMRREGAAVILDRSVNQTLSRSIITSGTTLLTVAALFFLGGEVIHSFSFTLMIGIVFGSYSSIFQSCAWLKVWEKKLVGRKKT